jgi:uncharacterized protein with GYD domain
MASYVVLVNWTEQGVADFRDSPKRARAFSSAAKDLGCKVKSLYWTLGSYDIVSIVEGPDDETITALALRVGSLGNVRTTTLRAFEQAEFAEILKKAG